MNSTDLKSAIIAIQNDIKLRTSLPCNFSVNEEAIGDNAELKMIYVGLVSLDYDSGNNVISVEYRYKLKLTSNVSNEMQLAELMDAEIKTALSLPSTNTVNTSAPDYTELTISGYKVLYEIKWEENTNEMNYNEFLRTWILNIKINKE
jgi:hypothetical protein